MLKLYFWLCNRIHQEELLYQKVVSISQTFLKDIFEVPKFQILTRSRSFKTALYFKEEIIQHLMTSFDFINVVTKCQILT